VNNRSGDRAPGMRGWGSTKRKRTYACKTSGVRTGGGVGSGRWRAATHDQSGGSYGAMRGQSTARVWSTARCMMPDANLMGEATWAGAQKTEEEGSTDVEKSTPACARG